MLADRRHFRTLANAVAFLALAAAPGRAAVVAAAPDDPPGLPAWREAPVPAMPAAQAVPEQIAASDELLAADAVDQVDLVAGDCNRDDEVGAADVSALALRVFGLSFTGNQTCDANGDGPVDAGDLSCTVLKIFEGPNVCGVSDPEDVATEPDTTVPTSLPDALSFLYTGDNPIQRGVATGVITFTRAAGLRGQVRLSGGEGLSGVRVTVLDHPEYGHTFTRLDGMWDMAVNGGGWLTMRFEKAGYLDVDRKIDLPWSDWGYVDDVVMIAPDPNAPLIDLTLATPIQVARGSVITDTTGTRQAAVYFKAGTTATMTLPGGGTQNLPGGHLRITEYTVGDEGPAMMPAALPAASAYTYASSIDFDEAKAAGATRVTFNQPVVYYLDNFMNIPVGEGIPYGYYDDAKAVWVAEDNGIVVKIVSVTGGMADIDADGDDIADAPAQLAALGFNDAEREQLASDYPVGKELWRIPCLHFTPTDFNVGAECAPLTSCVPPRMKAPNAAGQPTDNPCIQNHSIIGCENQTLGETLDFVGVPFRLFYQSDQTLGALANYRLNIPLVGDTVPAGVEAVRLQIRVAGKFIDLRLPPSPNLTRNFDWDGRDVFNRLVRGVQEIRTRVGYAYELVPAPAVRFGRFPTTSSIAVWYGEASARFEGTLWQEWKGTIGGWPAESVGLGGWTPEIYHGYDAHSKVLYMGDGTQRSADTLPPVIRTVAGSGQYWYTGDNGPAGEAGMSLPVAIDLAADGSMLITQSDDGLLRRVATDGRITTIAGKGLAGFTEGILASLFHPSSCARALAVGPQGDIYLAQDDIGCNSSSRKIWRISPGGTVHHFAGTTSGNSGDGGPATQAQFNRLGRMGVGKDGSVYVADPGAHRVRKVLPDGTITTVAGTGVAGFGGDNGHATAAQLSSPEGVAEGPDGSVYIADFGNYRIRRILPTGVITTYVGGGGGFVMDVPRLQAEIGQPMEVRIGGDGLLYFSNNRRLMRLDAGADPNQIVRRIAGVSVTGFGGDGGPATSALLSADFGFVVDANGTALLADRGNHRIRKVENGIITTIIGTASRAPYGLGGHARSAFLGMSGGGRTAFAPDGTMYIAAEPSYLFRVRPDGVVEHVAGGGGSLGDGGPATQASVSIGGLAVGTDGSVYISGSNRIRRITPNGIINTIAGGGNAVGNNIPALGASLCANNGLAVDEANNIYFSCGSQFSGGYVRRIGPDGILSTIAGGGLNTSPRATDVALSNIVDVAVDRQGNLYLADAANWAGYYRVHVVGTDGILRAFAGGTGSGDGGPAIGAPVVLVSGLAVGHDGTVYIMTSPGNVPVVRAVTPDGIIRTVAGTAPRSEWGDDFDEGGPAKQARLGSVGSAALSIGPDGSLYISEMGRHRIRRVEPAVTGLKLGESSVASEDGSEVYVFGSDGRHLRTLDGLTGAVLLTFGHDSARRLVSISDAEGNVTSIQRDAAGKPLSITSPYGQVTTLALDANGYLSEVLNPAGETIQLTSSARGLLTSMTDPRGNTHIYQYDADGRLERDTNPAGGYKELTRTPGSSPKDYTVAVETAMGRTTTYHGTRDDQNATTRQITGPDGLVIASSRSASQTSSVTRPSGTVSSWTDAADPRFGMQAPLAQSESVTTPGGRSLSVTRSRYLSLSALNDPYSANPLVETTTVNGRQFTSSYMSATRVFTDTTAAGRKATTFIDALGRPTEAIVPGIEPVEFAYDARGRLASATQGSGVEARTVALAYNAQGYLASVTDPIGRISSFAYDAAGRVTSQTLPDGRVIGFGYDESGNNTRVTPPERPDHFFTFNAVDLTASYNPPDLGPDSEATTYSYNLDKQITNIARPNGRNVVLGYDASGRPSSVAIQRGSVTFSYHPTTGNPTSVTAPGGIGLAYTYDGSLATSETLTGPVAGGTGYTYDNDFRVTSQTVNGANSVSMSYDNDGLLTQVGGLVLNRDAQNGLLTGSAHGSVIDHWRYNGFAEPISYTAKSGGTPLYDVQYDRDSLGRITTKTETITATTSIYDYTYDTAGRLTQVELNGSPVEAYTYDANSNRLTFTGPGGAVAGTYDAQDRMLTYGGATYAYNINGELMSKTMGAQVTTYDYDELGNLMHVVLPSGTAIDYLIDGRNRRIGKKVNGALVQGFLWSGQLRPVAELDGAGALVSRFVYATQANVPDYMVKGGVTYRIVTDQVGSVRLVVNTATGAVVQRMDYDAFGRVLADTNPGWQPFGFAGGLYDEDTGLVRFGARDYDAEGGRWGAKDPIGFGGGPNRYAYANNDSANFVDHQGNVAVVAAPAVIGVGALLIIGGAAGVFGGHALAVTLERLGVGQQDRERLGDRQAEYDKYKQQCGFRPDNEADDCAKLSKQISQVQICLQLRNQWDTKWSPGHHAGEIAGLQNRLVKLKLRHFFQCSQVCQ